MNKEIIKLYTFVVSNKDFLIRLGLDADKIISILDLYNTKNINVYDFISIKNYNNKLLQKTYYPIGSFNVYLENNNFFNFFEVILSLYLTKNKANFNIKNDYKVDFIVKLFNEIIGEDDFTINKIDNYNNVLCIGSKSYYEQISSVTYNKIIYIPCNDVDIFVDKGVNIDLEDYKLNLINHTVYKDMNINEAINRINTESSLYKSIIFSNNSLNTEKFINSINSKNILVNMIDYDNYLDIDLDTFLYLKNITVKRGE